MFWASAEMDFSQYIRPVSLIFLLHPNAEGEFRFYFCDFREREHGSFTYFGACAQKFYEVIGILQDDGRVNMAISYMTFCNRLNILVFVPQFLAIS